MIISLIAAMGKNRVIGRNGKLPWSMPADLKFFRDTTMGKPIIMGRKTFESMQNPLPDRKNIVITHDKDYKAKGAVVVHSIDEALKAAKNSEEIMVIGGQKIFEQFMQKAKRIYLTIIGGNFEGDTFFPKLGKEWKEIKKEEHKGDEKNPHDYSFLMLEK